MQTISDGYRDLNRKLHEDRPDYGANGHRYGQMLFDAIVGLGAKSLLDYGCGKGTLGQNLRANFFKNGIICDVREYDPAIEGKEATPEPAEIVYCGDVLEHIEPEFLDNVLADLERCTQRMAILTIACRPAVKTLADGRNAHLIVEPWTWWLEKIEAAGLFITAIQRENDGEFVAVVAPKRNMKHAGI